MPRPRDLSRGGDDGLGEQVTLFHRRRTQPHGLIGEGDMGRPGVGIRVDGDGGNAEALAGSENAAGDFAAVGDQDLLQHEADASIGRPTEKPGRSWGGFAWGGPPSGSGSTCRTSSYSV